MTTIEDGLKRKKGGKGRESETIDESKNENERNNGNETKK
jgi:hypothetical protein